MTGDDEGDGLNAGRVAPPDAGGYGDKDIRGVVDGSGPNEDAGARGWVFFDVSGICDRADMPG